MLAQPAKCHSLPDWNAQAKYFVDMLRGLLNLTHICTSVQQAQMYVLVLACLLALLACSMLLAVGQLGSMLNLSGPFSRPLYSW